MGAESSETKIEYSTFQLQLWRRSVGPWVSQFESVSNGSLDGVDKRAEWSPSNRNYAKNEQGLWVKKKTKPKTKQAGRSDKFRYDSTKASKIHGDPHKTIFVARLNYSTPEGTLLEVFSKFGSIERCQVVKNCKTGRSRGYAFVEFFDENDAKRTLRETRDKHVSIDGQEVLVDRVRAGVVPSWLPRRLGGGLGQRQKGTQRFAWKLAYFGDSSRIDYGEMHRKQQLWWEHCRRSTKQPS